MAAFRIEKIRAYILTPIMFVYDLLRLLPHAMRWILRM